MKTESETAFDIFLEGWLVRQEHFMEELNCTLEASQGSSEEDLRELISRVLGHYQQYYEEKSRMANRNVFLVFSPPWFTPFERTFFWIAGFKPGLAFQLVRNALTDMSDEQRQRMEVVKSQTTIEERELGNTMAAIQESVAVPPLMEMARVSAGGDVDTAVEILRSKMETVLGSADMLRSRTAERVVEILSPIENVRFLAAATELQLRIRQLGLEKRGERRQTSWFGW